MNHSILAAATAASVVLAFSAAVMAQQIRPDRAIKYRQGLFNAMGYNFYGILGPMAKGDIPFDKDRAVRAATLLSTLAEMPYDGFTPGSDKGAPTKAKPEIWTQRAKFDKLASDMQAETVKLVAATKTGDQGAFRSAVQATGKACSNCHDEFRNE